MKSHHFVLALCLLSPLVAVAQHNHNHNDSSSPSNQAAAPYAGMQSRPIKSLSDQDIGELKRGAGWGLALPAELNGMPGPAHLLELKDQIPLSAEQVKIVQTRYDQMRQAAIPVGEQLIAAEAAIEAAFASGRVEEVSLRRLLADAERARTQLRFIHLSQHYKTVAVLQPQQIQKYNVLRGYAADPCKSIPEGHNPEMYRRHMGCN